MAALDDSGRQNDVFGHLIHVPIPVFDAESDSDRVEAKLGQKWVQIDDFQFSPPKRVFGMKTENRRFDLEPFLAEFGLNSVRIGLSVKNLYRNMY